MQSIQKFTSQIEEGKQQQRREYILLFFNHSQDEISYELYHYEYEYQSEIDQILYQRDDIFYENFKYYQQQDVYENEIEIENILCLKISEKNIEKNNLSVFSQMQSNQEDSNIYQFRESHDTKVQVFPDQADSFRNLNQTNSANTNEMSPNDPSVNQIPSCQVNSCFNQTDVDSHNHPQSQIQQAEPKISPDKISDSCLNSQINTQSKSNTQQTCLRCNKLLNQDDLQVCFSFLCDYFDSSPQNEYDIGQDKGKIFRWQYEQILKNRKLQMSQKIGPNNCRTTTQ